MDKLFDSEGSPPLCNSEVGLYALQEGKSYKTDGKLFGNFVLFCTSGFDLS